MDDNAHEPVIYEGKRIKVWRSPDGGFYASIGAVDGEVESYISRSESADEALQAAKSFIDAQRIVI